MRLTAGYRQVVSTRGVYDLQRNVSELVSTVSEFGPNAQAGTVTLARQRSSGNGQYITTVRPGGGQCWLSLASRSADEIEVPFADHVRVVGRHLSVLDTVEQVGGATTYGASRTVKIRGALSAKTAMPLFGSGLQDRARRLLPTVRLRADFYLVGGVLSRYELRGDEVRTALAKAGVGVDDETLDWVATMTLVVRYEKLGKPVTVAPARPLCPEKKGPVAAA